MQAWQPKVERMRGPKARFGYVATGLIHALPWLLFCALFAVGTLRWMNSRPGPLGMEPTPEIVTWCWQIVLCMASCIVLYAIFLFLLSRKPSPDAYSQRGAFWRRFLLFSIIVAGFHLAESTLMMQYIAIFSQ
jgi:hypothetical protein